MNPCSKRRKCVIPVFSRRAWGKVYEDCIYLILIEFLYQISYINEVWNVEVHSFIVKDESQIAVEFSMVVWGIELANRGSISQDWTETNQHLLSSLYQNAYFDSGIWLLCKLVDGEHLLRDQ